MKPADFFIGSREFFGSLIPGLLWLIAIVFLLVNASMQKLLELAADANWIGVLLFIGLSLLIGTLLQRISFNFARRVHKFLREAEQPNSRYPKISRFLNSRIVKRFIGESLAPMPYRTALLTRAERMINERLQEAYPNLKRNLSDPADQLQDAYPSLEGVHFDPADRLYQGERQVFTACKRSVLARSQELGRALKEQRGRNKSNRNVTTAGGFTSAWFIVSRRWYIGVTAQDEGTAVPLDHWNHCGCCDSIRAPATPIPCIEKRRNSCVLGNVFPTRVWACRKPKG